MFCNSQLRKRAWEQDKLEPVASQQPANKRFKFVTESTVENLLTCDVQPLDNFKLMRICSSLWTINIKFTMLDQ